MELPRCCEREMRVTAETGKFVEAHCDLCGDVVYIKKTAVVKPQLLDD